jgi:hypothetical protein
MTENTDLTKKCGADRIKSLQTERKPSSMQAMCTNQQITEQQISELKAGKVVVCLMKKPYTTLN